MNIYSPTIEERGPDMIRKIRARFSNGVIKPLENVEFSEGSELTLTITEKPTKAEDEAFLRAAGSWRGLIDCDKLLKDIYADRKISTRPDVKL